MQLCNLAVRRRGPGNTLGQGVCVPESQHPASRFLRAHPCFGHLHSLVGATSTSAKCIGKGQLQATF